MILVHHTRKVGKQELADDPFQALSGAGCLRSFYTTGMILHASDEEKSPRRLVFELRCGKPISTKHVDKVNGQWCEMNVSNERTVRKDYGQKMDKERERIWGVILKLIRDQAREGQLHTPIQFSKTFAGYEGLGGRDAIYNHINDLCTMGYIKFTKQEKEFERSKYGAMCVENMEYPLEKPIVDEETGERVTMRRILPTHFTDVGNGELYPVENPEIWVYRESSTNKHKKDQQKYESSQKGNDHENDSV